MRLYNTMQCGGFWLIGLCVTLIIIILCFQSLVQVMHFYVPEQNIAFCVPPICSTGKKEVNLQQTGSWGREGVNKYNTESRKLTLWFQSLEQVMHLCS